MRNVGRFKRYFAAVAIVTAALAPAKAQTWPTRPITMVLPLTAGGGSDAMSRVIALRLGELLGQSIIVENVGGVGGMLGASRVARAAPDGYEFLLATSGTHALNQSIYAKPLYNAVTDFTPVALIVDMPLVLMTRKDLPVNNLQEFIAYARANQNTMQYGSSGVGGTGHVACALLNSAIGVDIVHVPYRGGGPAMNDLLAGRLDYQCALASIAMPPIQGGQAKALTVLSTERSPIVPTLASTNEQGLPNFEASAWNAIFLPKDTPQAIVDKLHDAIVAAIETPAVKRRIEAMGVTVVSPERRTPAYLQAFVEREIEKWSIALKAAHIQPQ